MKITAFTLSSTTLVPLLFAGLVSCSKPQPTTTATGLPVAATKEAENDPPTAEQASRRAKSESLCKAHSMAVYGNPNAMNLPGEAETHPPAKEEVIHRALALLLTGIKSEGMEDADLKEVDKKYGISPYLSPSERAFMDAATPTQQQVTDANWKYECMHVMLWALGFHETLSWPSELADVGADAGILFGRSSEQLVKDAKLRSTAELLDATDLILRIHWACENARVSGGPAPTDVDCEVVMERHKALNWLIHLADAAWDDVGADT